MEHYAVIDRIEDVEKWKDEISYTNMLIKQNIPILIRNLKEGDQVRISSVKMFSSVGEFLTFAQNIQRKRASLEIVEQPVLQFSNDENWTKEAEEYLLAIAKAEEIAKEEVSNYLCKTEEQEIMETIVLRMSIHILGRIFTVEQLPVWDEEVQKERGSK